MMTIYKFHHWFGGIGCLSSAFIADSDVVARAIGREVYLCEIFGEGSDVRFDLAASDLAVVSNDPVAIETVRSLGLNLGQNPLAALRCPECHEATSDPDDLSCVYCRSESRP